MAKTFRRIVTGHDKNGTAIVVSDAEASHLLERDTRPGVRLTNFWISNGTPAEYDGPEDTCIGDFVLHPPANGSVFRCVEFGPEDPEVMAKVDGKAAFAAMGAADNVVDNARHPYMHRTDSVDYAIVLKGEIDMLLDDSEVHLVAGDIVIQRGTNHAWANRGTESCIIAFVLVDGVTSRDAEPQNARGIPARD